MVLSLFALSGPIDAASKHFQRLTVTASLRDSATRLQSSVDLRLRLPPFAEGERLAEQVVVSPPPPLPYSERPTNDAVGVFIPVTRPGTYAPFPLIQAGHSDTLTLTFDDCGTPDQMEGIVNSLAAVKRQAIFFITGQCRDHYPWLVDTLRAAGHMVCNHTYSHPDLRRLSNLQVRWEIGAGVFAGCPYFRPPYGAWDGPRGRIARIAAEFGLTPMLWDVDSRDWAGAPAQRIAVSALGRGGIVLLHLHGDFTAEAVRLIGQVG